MSEPEPITTTPATHITNAISKVIQLPELVEHIGLFLQFSDLSSCVQVNRLWKNTLIPILWHTINTSTRPWSHIIDDILLEGRPREEIEKRVQMAIAKYGRHIRDLTVHWGTVLDAVSFSSECKNLRSLDVVDLRRSSGVSLPPPPPPQPYVVSEIGPATINASRRTTTTVDYQLPWIQSYSVAVYGTEHSYSVPVNVDTVQRHFIERIWILLRQNPYLTRLSFPNLGSLSSLPQKFILDSLMSLHHLRDLDANWLPLDIQTILRTLPKLERVHVKDLVMQFPFLPGERFHGLRMLSIRLVVLLGEVFKMLEHLPGLEELRLQAVRTDWMIQSLQAIINAAAESRVRDLSAVKTLQYASMQSQWEDQYIAFLVGQFPQLSRIKVPILWRKTEQALWENCYFLDEIDSLNAGSKIYKWRRRREVREDGEEDEDDALEAMLA
ncbi:MAG: hypothetical protein JOS17DRAFT_744512 [Linnemannia elongata]|nr:MAG: hypothetical protein JOS17DRAFT_744512 [Linnemannia elongata]